MISFRLQLGHRPYLLNGLPIPMVCFNDLGLSRPICTLQGYEQSAYLDFYLGVWLTDFTSTIREFNWAETRVMNKMGVWFVESRKGFQTKSIRQVAEKERIIDNVKIIAEYRYVDINPHKAHLEILQLNGPKTGCVLSKLMGAWCSLLADEEIYLAKAF